MRPWPAPALLVLAALMVLAPTPSAASAAQNADKPKATISLRYTLPPSGGRARTVVVESLGPAPMAPATLVDGEGRVAVRAVARDLAEPA